jgi:hypothetical protein
LLRTRCLQELQAMRRRRQANKKAGSLLQEQDSHSCYNHVKLQSLMA